MEYTVFQSWLALYIGRPFPSKYVLAEKPGPASLQLTSQLQCRVRQLPIWHCRERSYWKSHFNVILLRVARPCKTPKFFQWTLSPEWKSEFRLLFHFLSRTLSSGQTEGHGGGRYQDVSEDGSVPAGQRRGALLQQVQHCKPDVPGHITTDVQQHKHMLFTKEADKQTVWWAQCDGEG